MVVGQFAPALFVGVPPPKPHDPIRDLLAGNMKRLRGELGWSQIELAEKADLHRTYVGDLERCRRNITIDNLAKLSRGLGVDPRELLAPAVPKAS